MSKAYGTRTDCVRDNKKVICPNASMLGYGKRYTKRGDWIQFEQDDHQFGGRVVGHVECEGQDYVEIIRFDTMLAHVWVNWVMPEQVRVIFHGVPHATIDFLTGAWTDPDAILRKAHNGFVHENLIDT